MFGRNKKEWDWDLDDPNPTTRYLWWSTQAEFWERGIRQCHRMRRFEVVMMFLWGFMAAVNGVQGRYGWAIWYAAVVFFWATHMTRFNKKTLERYEEGLERALREREISRVDYLTQRGF